MAPKRSIREEIQWRAKVTFGIVFIIGSLITAQIFVIQVFQKKKWADKMEKVQSKPMKIRAQRGNIFAADGRSLLATSVPRYRVGIDVTRAKPAYFKEKIDSLCRKLANFFQDRSAEDYKRLIKNAREEKKLIFVALGNRLVDYQERQQIKTFPFFREGPMKGGGKFERLERRVMPFDDMALRSIGKLDRDTQTRGDFGIEFSFNNYLAGRDGVGLFQRLTGGVWKPVEDSPEVRPEAGLDVITTIDVNYQDIVESALRNQVINTNAKYGSAVVMEIATGEIKAITNLSRRNGSDSTSKFYTEDFNYAVRGGTDPGSTFKLATMVALLEKSNLSLNEDAGFCGGSIMHNKTEMTCSEEHGNQTVKQVFEHSCNIGIYNLVKKHFGFSNADEFVSYLTRFKLDQPVGFQLKGETEPIIKNRKSSTFSNTTIPWMSIGYETRLTPLQMLTFYNAIANNGHWVQPLIVKEIREADRVTERFEANQDPTPICSERTAKLAQEMMRGVVENGTAQNINTGFCKVAGKTGTSRKRENGYVKNQYYTAFIGFFPADNPKYSCAVIIDEPQGANLYARDVAAPVFRTIADKIFAYDVALHPSKNKASNIQKIQTQAQAGYAEDFRTVNEELGIQNSPSSAGWVKASKNGSSVAWQRVEDRKDLPDVSGMSLRDAIHILENKGFKVRYSGLGKVSDYAIVQPKVVSLVLK
ncbi:penicillin-binding protein transpeptidase [Emticicia oligotrophica DSM 17448]|uniref:Penicillin-binding protein transpeptidase n=1 Tax=Emticicia oligotrophica (strain DSM 17448 / CIP 109782 / MTCC 6937 / GPTSA100-15) TaxID=929562 RepID=A0ABM5N057_EMTOG|nr:penicillin-binding transpeptidase domain-containing protein [Emticicia oligotrophica]AFK02816.1 penicillin-binding protein transpeptidase [Emticicia oligotrophica DSM 17448]